MAFVGTHVLMAYAGSGRANDSGSQSILGQFIESDHRGTGFQAFDLVAPPIDRAKGKVVFRIRSSEDMYVSIGETNDMMRLCDVLPANTTQDYYVNPGDKVTVAPILD